MSVWNQLRLGDQDFRYLSLSAIAKLHQIELAQMPVAHKILLENCYRYGLLQKLDVAHMIKPFVERYGNQPSSSQSSSSKNKHGSAIKFMPARVLMQDFTGVPALVDMAALRDAYADQGGDPEAIRFQCPVDLVIDHSVQVDKSNAKNACQFNVNMEMIRNRERYQFLKWGQQSFDQFRLIPPGKGICHQVNIEYLAPVVATQEIEGHWYAFPDTLVGLDSHTTMVNALGVLGWGVGGIEAESVLLGYPIDFLLPEVVGVELTGKLKNGVTATDLVLSLTELFRQKSWVGRILEFCGPGLAHLSLQDRATISNMSPEFGTTSALFPVDQETLRYLRMTGRSDDQVDLVGMYSRKQFLWASSHCHHQQYQEVISFDMSQVKPCVSGPSRPQDRVALPNLGLETSRFLVSRGHQNELKKRFQVTGRDFSLSHGDIVLAAITSCTNTSNPQVLIAAGLLAKNAIQKGLMTKPWVKTSFAPGSPVVVDYLNVLGLMEPLAALGFSVVGFGCTTCIGNSGPLDDAISNVITQEKVCVSAVLSGNRNFEGRIHPQVAMNWLASPPLVVAYALLGATGVDITREHLGHDSQGSPVYLDDIWPDNALIEEMMQAINQSMYREQYEHIEKGDHHWASLIVEPSTRYPWRKSSTYIQKPDFVAARPRLNDQKTIEGARILLWLGDSVTTDHISPAGNIKPDSPAGLFLQNHGVKPEHFNSYGSRRGNHEVMMRGAFANIRIQNKVLPGISGGYARYVPTQTVMSVYDAAMKYAADQIPLVVIAGSHYGSGSSRDWAAKGTFCLGVKVVIAKSFERIHRSNLIGMGVLPCEFAFEEDGDIIFEGDEKLSITGLEHLVSISTPLMMILEKSDGSIHKIELKSRIDTAQELKLYHEGGMFPSMLKRIQVS
ncbi:MAG: aconitate hydratase AcnA [Pseudomonadota bacterium]|nr:aconitate hydratase AcnA [Pseudomonadota bacterium]